MPAVLADSDAPVVQAPEEVKPGGPGGGGPSDFEPGGNGWGGGDDESHRKRPDGGPSLGMLGILVTLISITTLFATIVIAYAVRARTRAHWDPVMLPSILWVSTGLIVLSSVTLELARRGFHRLRAQRYAVWLTVTFFLGLGFMLSQAVSLRQLVLRGVYLRQNPHSSLFYVVTAAHGLHLFGGMLALFYLICRAPMRTLRPGEYFDKQRSAVSITAVYWHFLTALWIGLFLLLLLWN